MQSSTNKHVCLLMSSITISKNDEHKGKLAFARTCYDSATATMSFGGGKLAQLVAALDTFHIVAFDRNSLVGMRVIVHCRYST